MIKKLNLFATIFLAFTTNTFAINYYVFTNGNNNTNTGLNLACPF